MHSPILVRVPVDGSVAAVCNRWGRRGLIFDLPSGAKLMELDRGDYHPEQTDFPVAFLNRASELSIRSR